MRLHCSIHVIAGVVANQDLTQGSAHWRSTVQASEHAVADLKYQAWEVTCIGAHVQHDTPCDADAFTCSRCPFSAVCKRLSKSTAVS